MAALSFSVHVDKENETPAALSHKANIKSFGPRKGKLTQQTPRKALFDVNNELQLSSKVSRPRQISEPLKKPGKSRLNIIKDFENQNSIKSIKKPETKKELTQKSMKGLEVQKRQNILVKSQPKQKPTPKITNDVKCTEDEEWDAIFPRQDRLSSYVDKLFSWRPPCLFGHLPDSEESDLSEPEDNLDRFNLIVEPVLVDELPEIDLSELAPVPLPEFDCPDTESQSNDVGQIDSDFALLPTPDTSLSLGTLTVMQDSSFSSTEHSS